MVMHPYEKHDLNNGLHKGDLHAGNCPDGNDHDLNI